MASHETGLVPPRRLDNAMTSQLVFLDESISFDCAAQTAGSDAPRRHVGDTGPRTREPRGFMDEKPFSVARDLYFATTPAPESVFPRSISQEACKDPRDLPEMQNWREGSKTPSEDCSDEEDENDDEVDDGCDEIDGEVGTPVSANHPSRDKNGIANSSDGVHSLYLEKMSNADGKLHSSIGSCREILARVNGMVQSMSNHVSARPIENHLQGHAGNYHGTVTMAEPLDMYHLQFLQGPEGQTSGQKEFIAENGSSFSGRKDIADLSEPGDSLRAILSDPFTGMLMDDAMILPCGHSFGTNGLQHILRMKACSACSLPMTEDSVAPNLSLRAAVQAFRREEASMLCGASKKRRLDKERGNYGDSYFDQPRGRGVQFPLAVTDRVIIKGNKRTPLRFVGQEAIVTMQCLNGWYVVKMLDSAESVKLQYRSLMKITDHSSSLKPPSSSKTSNWL